MAGKGKSGWKGDSRGHSLARRGIKITNAPPSDIRIDETSGIWFESNGVVSEMVSLIQLLGFDDLVEKKKASGLPKEQYQADASKIIVYPSDKSKETTRWLMKEYIDGDRVRKNQVRKLLNIAIKEIDGQLRTQKHIDIRIDLHKSRKMFRELEKELN